MTYKLFVVFAAVTVALFGQEAATLTHVGALDDNFQPVVNQLKADGYEIKSASKEARVETELVVTGSYRQTGTFVKVSFILNGASSSIRVGVYEVKRFKALKTEPWSDPKINTSKSAQLMEKLKQELKW